jgi:hypothetical protein
MNKFQNDWIKGKLNDKEFMEKFEREFFPKQSKEELEKVMTPEIAKALIKAIKPFTKKRKNVPDSKI